MPQWIAVSGKKRHGKDTIADRLVDEHGFTRISFADVMREVALGIDPYVAAIGAPPESAVPDLGIIRYSELLDRIGYHDAKEYPDVRRYLQRVGTEGGRDVYGEDHWVDLACQRAEQVGGPVVFADCRFLTEANPVRSRGGQVWRVNRPGIVSTDKHKSETELDDYDFDLVFTNDSTIRALELAVDAHVSRLLAFRVTTCGACECGGCDA